MSLPTADDLFRPTSPEERDDGSTGIDADPPRGTRVVSAVPHRRHDDGAGDGSIDGNDDGNDDGAADQKAKQRRRSSGRVRHDEKMTVYVTAEELLDLEHARLALRRDHGIAVDRGRLVREALAIVLADLEHHADDSDLVKRLEA